VHIVSFIVLFVHESQRQEVDVTQTNRQTGVRKTNNTEPFI